MRLLVPLFMSLSFVPAGLAQTTRVIPAAASKADGNNAAVSIFSHGAGRTQHIWRDHAVTKSVAILRGIAYRYEDLPIVAKKRDLPRTVITMGHTSVSPDRLSPTFAKNVTARMTAIFTGTLSAPAQPAKGSNPRPFNIKVPMKVSFLYTKTKGHLLMDWRVPGPNTAVAYLLDAAGVPSGQVGKVTTFGRPGRFADNTAPVLSGATTKLVPGGTLQLGVGNLNRQYVGRLIFGLTNQAPGLPFDLGKIGARGNQLYISVDAVLPFAARQTGGRWHHVFTRTIPNDQGLLGFQLFAQSYFADARANAAGLVASNAVRMTLPRFIGKEMNSVIALSAAATSGIARTDFWGFGPVVQFTGLLP